MVAVARAMSLDVQVRKQYDSANSAASFLLDVNLQFPPGFTVLFGPSGAGKSTLLDCIAGLLTPDAGRIALDNTVFYDRENGVALPPQRREVAYVFQNLALFPHLSVAGNIAYGLAHLPADESRERIAKISSAFHIEPLLQRKPRQLSGGEQQRVALARSLVTQPRVFLLDEPLTGLDAGLRCKILDDLREWNAANNIPILYVTHNRDEVDAIGKRIVILEQGRVQESGHPRNVLDAPRSMALAQAAGFENLLHGVVLEHRPADGVMRVALSLSNRELEVPLGTAPTGSSVQIAVRAGDILLATEPPKAISARNILPGTVLALELRGSLYTVQVDAGLVFTVHVTPGAVRSLQMAVGQRVWLVLKTHSCHLVA
jgi:molybdate transport system ATP-binding protein